MPSSPPCVPGLLSPSEPLARAMDRKVFEQVTNYGDWSSAAKTERSASRTERQFRAACVGGRWRG